MNKDSLESMVKTLKGGYIRDIRFKTAFLDALNEKAGPNLAALCEWAIGKIEEDEKNKMSQ